MRYDLIFIQTRPREKHVLPPVIAAAGLLGASYGLSHLSNNIATDKANKENIAFQREQNDLDRELQREVNQTNIDLFHEQNQFNQQEAEKTRQFNTYRSKVNDLLASGLNPSILSGGLTSSAQASSGTLPQLNSEHLPAPRNEFAPALLPISDPASMLDTLSRTTFDNTYKPLEASKQLEVLDTLADKNRQDASLQHAIALLRNETLDNDIVASQLRNDELDAKIQLIFEQMADYQSLRQFRQATIGIDLQKLGIDSQKLENDYVIAMSDIHERMREFDADLEYKRDVLHYDEKKLANERNQFARQLMQDWSKHVDEMNIKDKEAEAKIKESAASAFRDYAIGSTVALGALVTPLSKVKKIGTFLKSIRKGKVNSSGPTSAAPNSNDYSGSDAQKVWFESFRKNGTTPQNPILRKYYEEWLKTHQ